MFNQEQQGQQTQLGQQAQSLMLEEKKAVYNLAKGVDKMSQTDVDNTKSNVLDDLPKISIEDAQGHSETSANDSTASTPRQTRKQRKKKMETTWAANSAINHLKVFASKAEERENKRRKKIEALKRRIKRMTVSGTLSGFIWFVCIGVVIYQGIKCVNKYIDGPKGAEVFMVYGSDEMFPHFTVCGYGNAYIPMQDCNQQW